VPVLELHSEHGVRKRLDDRARDLNDPILGQTQSPLLGLGSPRQHAGPLFGDRHRVLEMRGS
jgi:hypothetical protein